MSTSIPHIVMALALAGSAASAPAQDSVLLKGVRYDDGRALLLPSESRRLVEACGPRFQHPLPGAAKVAQSLALVRRVFRRATAAGDAGIAYKIMDFPASDARLHSLDSFLAALPGRRPDGAEPVLSTSDGDYVLVWLAGATEGDRRIPAIVIFDRNAQITGVTADPGPSIPVATSLEGCSPEPKAP